MIRVDVYVYTEVTTDVSSIIINDFSKRVLTDGGTFESGACLLSTFESLGGTLATTLQAKKLDLFDDEKISVTSSIQNVNDISKTFTDFSQTFTIPATKNNNKIFKHWYDNSNDNPFSTLKKADAYIEIDTILFRKGKIQLESASIINNNAQDYSITFIGTLGNLKDKFAGLFLKDLQSNAYDFNYTGTSVKNTIFTATSSNVMFPLISSLRNWNYGGGGANDISTSGHPIIFSELFPAIRLSAMFKMIEEQFDVNFDGTPEEPSTFLTDPKFNNAYLFLKNADVFKPKSSELNIDFVSFDFNDDIVNPSQNAVIVPNVSDNKFTFNGLGWYESVSYGDVYFVGCNSTFYFKANIANVQCYLNVYKDDVFLYSFSFLSNNAATVQPITQIFSNSVTEPSISGVYKLTISSDTPVTFTSLILFQIYYEQGGDIIEANLNIINATNQSTTSNLNLASFMPEIKIEDFFSGVLKMFNLTCFSKDGTTYTIEQLESYYSNGKDIDITKYVLTDKKGLNRVKTFKKINFEYQKSESYVNVAFNSANGIEYGNLSYTNIPITEGEEYSIKLPFENLNFKNLKSRLQVGYNLKVDLQKYIPKPTILYDYNSTALTTLVDTHFHFSSNLNGSAPSMHSSYKAFGQETLISGDTFGLNFPIQQSTLTNELVTNGLYQNYYSNYFANIFNFKARLIKVNAILPTSIITTLKLNDNLVIQDTKYLINTMNVDLTSGEVDFELITDIR